MLKHVYIEGENTRSLYAVKYSDQNLYIKKLAFHNLPVEYLIPMLEATVPEFFDEAEELHRIRRAPWVVRKREKMSGRREYRLYILADGKWIDQKLMAVFHVSMNHKIGTYLHYWAGDLPAILAAVIQDFPPKEPYNLNVYEPVLYGGYKEPGESSGLKEALEAVKAMEVLQNE